MVLRAQKRPCAASGRRMRATTSTTCAGDGRQLVGVPQPVTGSTRRHARVIGAGIMPGQPYKNRCAELLKDELSQLLAALQQGFAVLGNLGGAATPVAKRFIGTSTRSRCKD